MSETMNIYVERSGGQWEARWWHTDEQRYFRFARSSKSESISAAVRATGYPASDCRIIEC